MLSSLQKRRLTIRDVQIELLILHILVVILGKSQYRSTLTVGYSGVCFGWISLLAIAHPSGQSVMKIGSFVMPPLLGPVLSLLITSILVPRASFIGHLSGIFAGLLLGMGLDKLAGTLATTALMSVTLVCTHPPSSSVLNRPAAVRLTVHAAVQIWLCAFGKASFGFHAPAHESWTWKQPLLLGACELLMERFFGDRM